VGSQLYIQVVWLVFFVIQFLEKVSSSKDCQVCLEDEPSSKFRTLSSPERDCNKMVLTLSKTQFGITQAMAD
jgi:hypothetical protein